MRETGYVTDIFILFFLVIYLLFDIIEYAFYIVSKIKSGQMRQMVNW